MNLTEFYFDALLRMRDVPAQQLQQPVFHFLAACGAHMQQSRAQLFQDVFVLFMLKNKRDGFFVEFGATNGVSLSNTYLLEQKFGWKGILAEPAKRWHADLKNNRKAAIDTRCVWTKTGEKLSFIEAESGELSTLAAFNEKDHYAESRKTGLRYDVETVSLNDLLALHGSPTNIDYMSVDTEGSEFDILSAFDFSRYQVGVFTIEHNFTPQREKIQALMTAKGYANVFRTLSKFDDWYVHQSVLKAFGG